jgi:hypothetical protein
MLSDNLKLLILFVVFLVGAYVTGKGSGREREGFEGGESEPGINEKVGGTPSRSQCPNLLIQKGTTLYLHNTTLAPVPGVNPIRFDNLEEYIEFIDWLRGQDIKCPILFLQHSVNAQGDSVYNIRPSPTDLRGGLCPSTGHVAGIDVDNVDSELNHDDGMGPGDGAFRLHSINAKASAASSRYDTVISPQQISEITKLIDQAGENDPYSGSKYPNVFGRGGDATIIRPADRESMLKIQASYLNQQKSG